MDKKAAQRIIGVFVLSALTIISLPLFFSKDETIIDVAPAANKAPPFATEAEKAKAEPSKPEPAVSSNAPATQSPTTVSQPTAEQKPAVTEPLAALSTQSSMSVSQQEEALAAAIAAAHQSSETSKQSAAVIPAQAITTPVTSKTTTQDAPLFPVIPVQMALGNHTASAEKNTVINVNKDNTKQPIANKDIIIKSFDIVTAFSIPSNQLSSLHNKELHKPVWVVQVGSFKSKANARHMTDYLRSEGFKAFIKTVKIKGQDTIQVFVGPELKQASAVQLSNRVLKQTSLHGKIVTFNALAL